MRHKRIISLLMSMALIGTSVTGVHADDSYSTNPSALLDSMKELTNEDDETFYESAKENLSKEAYEYLTQNAATTLGSSVMASAANVISSTDDIVKAARKNKSWYEKYKKKHKKEKNGHYYTENYGLGSSEDDSDDDNTDSTEVPWSGIWVAYLFYAKLDLFERSDAIDGELSDPSKWKKFMKDHAEYGTYSKDPKAKEIKAGDIIIWDGYIGVATGKGKFIGGDIDDTVKEKKISDIKNKLEGKITIATGDDLTISGNVKGKTVNIPQTVAQTWTASELHGHKIQTTCDWYTKGKGGPSGQICRYWHSKNEPMKDKIGILDGAYLCATSTPVGGDNGNVLAVKLSGGKTIKCIKIDTKSDQDKNYSTYGHMEDGKLSVVEFYLGTGDNKPRYGTLSVPWTSPFANQNVISVTVIGKLKGYEKY